MLVIKLLLWETIISVVYMPQRDLDGSQKDHFCNNFINIIWKLRGTVIIAGDVNYHVGSTGEYFEDQPEGCGVWVRN